MAIVDIKKPKTANQLAKMFGGDVKTIKKLNNLSKGQTISGPVKLGRGVGTNARNRIIPPSATARSLYVDPTPMYQPAMDFINKQVGQANQRYAANQADIKTIFGNLTTVRAQDKQKIQDQFTKSIADQQMSLASRTAEARAGSEAGAQQLAVTAGERGGGAMPTATPVQQAAEEGIARSNEYQQTWEALQNVMSQQAQNDVDSAVRGYDYQQASALEQLRNNLEERLSGLEAQGVDVRTQLAGAQLQGQQNVMQANYGEIQNREAQRAALAAAQARSAGGDRSKSSFGSDYAGIIDYVLSTKLGRVGANAVAESIDDIDSRGFANWQQADAAWNRQYGSKLTNNKLAIKKRVKKYFQDNYSYSPPRANSSATGNTMLPGLQPSVPGQ
jgi:hypothetical protein